MKAASPALVAFLNSVRAQRDKPLLMADCYTFTLASGLILTYTSVDVPVALNGKVYLANSILVDGLKYKCSTGLDVDQQQITISAKLTDTINGAPFLVALRDGAFDGCEVQRDRAFFSDVLGGTVIGSVLLFKGRVSTVDEVGRTTAKVTVASDLVLLDIDMPRNLYQPSCVHTLYDTGCTLIKQAYATRGAVGVGSGPLTINWAGALAVHAQGKILFTSGVNAGVPATVNSVDVGQDLVLRYPLQTRCTPGDTFTVYQGCDHTPGTCAAQFNNLSNFRGFPFVPPPETAY